jgi:transcriptional regulator with XRE-family HTH domain
MGFRENLKSELGFRGLLVKELAEKSGVKKKSLDKYLTENGSMPSAENAVKIARVLGVTVEYLVSGEDAVVSYDGARDTNTVELLRLLYDLAPEDRALLTGFAKLMKNRKKEGG